MQGHEATARRMCRSEQSDRRSSAFRNTLSGDASRVACLVVWLVACLLASLPEGATPGPRKQTSAGQSLKHNNDNNRIERRNSRFLQSLHLTSQQHVSVSQGRICLTSQQQASVSQGRTCLTSQQQASVSQGRTCLTSQQQASVSQGRICSDNFTCCHTEIRS